MSDEKYPISNVIEQSIQNQVNGLVGNNDVNLNTIVKMSLMNEMSQENGLSLIEKDEIKKVLNQIVISNQVESYFIHNEYELTYDMFGNLIPLSELDKFPLVNINGEKVEEITTDSSSIISKSR